MVRLTAELIGDSKQFINAVKDRELSLRGYKIPTIENLDATRNQFDTIDFTDNDIHKLENFPLLPRLKTLLFHSNRIKQLQPNIGEALPGLNTLILTNNNICELGDLEPLASIPKLEFLSLIGNPVVQKPQYRLFIIFNMPQIRVLDFTRIRMTERTAAKSKFNGSHDLSKEVVSNSQSLEAEPFPIQRSTLPFEARRNLSKLASNGQKATPGQALPVERLFISSRPPITNEFTFKYERDASNDIPGPSSAVDVGIPSMNISNEKELWITIVTNDNEGFGALVLGESIKIVSNRKLFCLYTANVSLRMVNCLQHIAHLSQLIQGYQGDDSKFIKTEIWRQYLPICESCVYVDPDTLILCSSDALFSYPELSIATHDAGIFVCSPLLETFSLLQLATVCHQGDIRSLLDAHFSIDDKKFTLPSKFQAVSSRNASDSSDHIVRFSGAIKPWDYVHSHGMLHDQVNSSHDVGHVEKWWEIFMDKVLPQLVNDYRPPNFSQ